MLVSLDLDGVSVSAGSACSSGAMKGSRVVGEMHLPVEVHKGFIRVSFGPDTTREDVDALLARLDRIVNRAAA